MSRSPRLHDGSSRSPMYGSPIWMVSDQVIHLGSICFLHYVDQQPPLHWMVWRHHDSNALDRDSLQASRPPERHRMPLDWTDTLSGNMPRWTNGSTIAGLASSLSVTSSLVSAGTWGENGSCRTDWVCAHELRLRSVRVPSQTGCLSVFQAPSTSCSCSRLNITF